MGVGEWLTTAPRAAWDDFREKGLRYSYLLMVPIVLVAAAVNLFLPHGWTAWPFVAAAGILLYIHEAAERNGQGVPPLYAYALFAGGVLCWGIVALVLSVINPIIVLLGVGAMAYVVARAIIRNRAAAALIDARRAANQCIHCGSTIARPDEAWCDQCEQDPNPDASQLQRIAAIAKNSSRSARARQALRPESANASARKAEAALLARSARRGGSSRKR